MSTKHTPGLLNIFIGNADGRGLIRIEQDGTGKHIASLHRGAEQEANAKRLAACWNALAGLNPEAVPALIAAFEKLNALQSDERQHLQPNGDRSDKYAWDIEVEEAWDAARAALALAKGETP